MNSLVEYKIDNLYGKIEKASENNYIRWENSSITNEEDGPDNIKSFLTERIEFLNSVWLDKDEYCKVSMNCNGTPVIPMCVMKGASASVIPNPNGIGFDEGTVWINDSTGEILDDEMGINEDLELHIDNYDEVIMDNKSKRGIYTVLSLLILFIFFIFTLCVDYRNNCWRGYV